MLSPEGQDEGICYHRAYVCTAYVCTAVCLNVTHLREFLS